MQFRVRAGVRFTSVRLVLIALLPFILNASTAGQQPPIEKADRPIAKTKEKLDRFGDPLPEGARLRLGTERFRQGGWSMLPSPSFPAASSSQQPATATLFCSTPSGATSSIPLNPVNTFTKSGLVMSSDLL